ncbi:MAG: tetratricopeptide repeat protein [Myxococcota bacterium]
MRRRNAADPSKGWLFATRTRRACALALASTALSGCFLWTTRGEGDQILEEGRERDERITALEEGTRREGDELTEQVDRAKRQVAELEQVLQKATKVVTRNSADLGLEVQALREQIGRLEGQIGELRNQIATQQRELQEERGALQAKILQIQQKIGMDVELDPAEIPSGRNEHYGAAYRAYQSREYSRARAMFREYVNRYGEDDQADNAQYWVGKTYLAQERPATALGEFRRVISDYPQGDAVDETLLDMADAFYSLNACSDARNALEALIRAHPRSSLIRQARSKLREVQRAPRGYCRG